jgi:hypothetical protein
VRESGSIDDLSTGEPKNWPTNLASTDPRPMWIRETGAKTSGFLASGEWM